MRAMFHYVVFVLSSLSRVRSRQLRLDLGRMLRDKRRQMHDEHADVVGRAARIGRVAQLDRRLLGVRVLDDDLGRHLVGDDIKQTVMRCA